MHVTGNDTDKGVALPPGAYSGCVTIMPTLSTSTETLKVYAATADDSDTIDTVDGDTAYVQTAGASVTYCTQGGTNWLTY